MSVSVTMPQLGESVTEGTVTRWLKQVGDTITADEPLLEISTDKVDTEIPAPASGVLLAISAAEDETVLVGAELGVIGAADEAGAAPAAPAAPAPVAAPEPVAAVVAPVAIAPEPAAVAAPAPTAPAVAAGGATVDVLLPQLGESVTEGTVTRWLKQVGDAVTVDEPLVEISTDKVDTELPSPATGVLLSILVAEDATADVGSVLGLIGSPDSAPAAAPAPAPAAPAPAVVAAPPTPPAPAP
ncbi:MAG TPA: 2-oxoglutarate dehydrogenase, E2 component, dihydrolipoamide succinyltransferase, partial [Actinobacteria bacterium]|nr:2-oxoglutarate dehydrogenase, E2 component, dihydrolipoamide succinyltransferase [Actinomycetota bacterium]